MNGRNQVVFGIEIWLHAAVGRPGHLTERPEPEGRQWLGDKCQSAEEAELGAAIDAVLSSPSNKKLVIAGPGTGKTTLFKRLLELTPEDLSVANSYSVA